MIFVGGGFPAPQLDSRGHHELKAPVLLTCDPRCEPLVFSVLNFPTTSHHLLTLKIRASRFANARIRPWEIVVAALLRSLLRLSLGFR